MEIKSQDLNDLKQAIYFNRFTIDPLPFYDDRRVIWSLKHNIFLIGYSINTYPFQAFVLFEDVKDSLTAEELTAIEAKREGVRQDLINKLREWMSFIYDDDGKETNQCQLPKAA